MTDQEFQYIDDLSVSHHCRANTFNPDTQHYDGRRCRTYVRPGELVCKRHGGSVPSVKTKAQVRAAEIQARSQMMKRARRNGITSIEDVYAELEENAAEAKAFREVCYARLEAITGGDDDWRYKSTAGEQLRAEVALYERAMDRANKFLIDMVRLGIADRRVKVDEVRAAMLVTVIQNILDRLDLSRDQRRVANIVAKEELMAISGPGE